MIALATAISLAIAIIATKVPAACASLRLAEAPDSIRSRPDADALHADLLAQGDDAGPDLGVPPYQVEKYVAVYKDMQRNHSLTVDVAAAKEGLTIAEFRELERKVGRDEAAREHVRIELQAGAASTP